uniref:Osiris 10b n=1 Tax=Drosophila melanogaster TaxID=7227 RepID=A0A6H2EDL7_DROME|nr:osiris 10b [Drosophila melanogaster]QJC18442.1 osiris 10b [Drosophila melanogaster]
MWRVVLLQCFVFGSSVLSLSHKGNETSANASTSPWSPRSLGRIIAHCMGGADAWQCLGSESEQLLDGATRDNSTWQITDYLSIEPKVGISKPETRRMDMGLPGKLLELVQGRALRLQLPRQLTISNAIDDFGSELGLDQGRKKKDKDKNMAMMGGMIMMATLAQMFLGKVILIAGSAFIMAKIALVISLLGSLKKGSTGHSGSGGGSGTEHVVVHSSHESGWHRSMPTHDTYSQLDQVEEPPLGSHMEYYQAYQMEPLKRRLHQAAAYPDQPRPEATKSTRGFI